MHISQFLSTVFFCFLTTTMLFAQTADSIFYEFSDPDRVMELDIQLEEISGLSLTHDSALLVAVQDESGVLYFLSKEDGSIVSKTSFRFSGDFEGVEFVDSTAYALKSNGDIFSIKNYASKEPQLDSFQTELKKKDDVEGLGYLASKNALLLACKGNPESDKNRRIFLFDLKKKTLSEKPFFEVNPIDVECALNKKKKSEDDCFSPSAIAVHPFTGEFYLLSAARKRVIILSPEGELLYAEKLEKSVMPQPEGIVFDKDGSMYISSEGKKGKKGTLMYFRPRRLE